MSSRRNPPPIPRKEVPANIQRARDELKARQNQERARRMVEIARQNRERRQVLTQEEADRVERLFQSRNELDAMAEIERRDRQRAELIAFQERQANSRQIGANLREARRRGEITREVAEARGKIKQALARPQVSQELVKESVAGRKITQGSDLSALANALFGGAGLEQVAREVRDKEKLKHTSLRPLPEPEPEPEPQPMGVGAGGEFVPLPSGEYTGRPRGGDTHGNIYGTQAGGGFVLKPFERRPESLPQPEPEPETNPYLSRKRE